MESNITPSALIDRLGGTTAVAKMCDLKPPSVSEWRKAGIPKPWLKFLRLARPDVFSDPSSRPRPLSASGQGANTASPTAAAGLSAAPGQGGGGKTAGKRAVA